MLEPLFQPFLIDWLVPSASTYADDIDFLWELIFWIVGAWFLATDGIHFFSDDTCDFFVNPQPKWQKAVVARVQLANETATN